METILIHQRTKIKGEVIKKLNMFKLSFEINGKRINPNQIGDAIEKAVLSHIQDTIKNSVGSVRCKTHGKAPVVTAKGRSVDKLSFHVSGCCEELIEQVQKKISNN